MIRFIFLKITVEEANLRVYFLASPFGAGVLLPVRRTKERCGCFGVSIGGNRVVRRSPWKNVKSDLE